GEHVAGSEASHEAVAHAAAVRGEHGGLDGGEHHEAPHIHMPDGSYFPIVFAAGMFIMALGLITNYWVCLVGLFPVMAALYGWCFEPVNAPTLETLPPAAGGRPVEAPRATVATH